MNEQLRVFAPGRVNLIGGHTDYSGGLVLPMAIDLGTTIVGKRGHERVVLVSRDEREPAEVALDVSDPASISPPWARYVAGVVAEVAPTTGFIGQVSTTLPIGTGLSSSAALEVAVALALVGDDRVDREQLALACQRAEHRASGVPCGIMDQLSSLMGVDGHALLINCTTLEVTPVSMPDDIAIVVVDSGERRSLSTVGYADRRAEVMRAAEQLGPLAHATLTEVEALEDETLRKRARHVVTENQRVRDVVEQLGRGDVEAVGRLMTESHYSLRDDQEVTTPALDDLVDRLIATPGVFGARLTGGGWGGSVVALAAPGVLDVGWTVRPSAGASVAPL
ncbi:MAG TPA: galactokinase [Acidimicrobiales bacterium]|nr:galactokinase [Acidimicrobiales bacterium]